MSHKIYRLAALLGIFVAAPAWAAAPTNGIDTLASQTSLPLSVQGVQFMLLDNSTPATPKITAAAPFYAPGYFHNSDIRLKRDIHTADGLATIDQLRGVNFNWRNDGSPSTGVLAQDVEKVMPGAVKVNAQGYKAVDYDQLMGPMIEAIKQLQAQNAKQSDEIAELRREIRK